MSTAKIANGFIIPKLPKDKNRYISVMQDIALLQANIAYAVINLTAYSFQMDSTEITVTGEKGSTLLHGSIAIDGKPWIGISSGDAHNLAGFALKEIGKELNKRSVKAKGTE